MSWTYGIDYQVTSLCNEEKYLVLKFDLNAIINR